LGPHPLALRRMALLRNLTIKIRTLYDIMPLTLFHGDRVDDNDPWCPVCFDLSYDNFEKHGKSSRQYNKANQPVHLRKGLLQGYALWWRGRPDFQQRAEQHECGYCAVLLQIIDRFWKRPTASWPPETQTLRVYELRVFKDGSVELLDMHDVPRSPLGLLLFTPSGIRMSPIGEWRLSIHYTRNVIDNHS
jgi:hypothetical protein